jgi:methyltransferase (TIGR00027 family)
MTAQERIMRPEQPSQTMVQTAIVRAAHQLLDRPLVFADPLAVGLLPEASQQAIVSAEAEHRTASMKRRRAAVVLRSRFAEDRLAAAAARGVRQYVIAAAGLDTFPWRQPEFARTMRIFVVDLPASLDWSRRTFQARGLPTPTNLTFVPADLEQRDLCKALARHGFEHDCSMFCSALGIIQFLTREAVDALFRFAASCPRGSEIAFSFSPPDDELEAHEKSGLHESVARGERFGEPWLTRIGAGELTALLTRLGFSEIDHLSAELAQARYFDDRCDGLRVSRNGLVMAAVV